MRRHLEIEILPSNGNFLDFQSLIRHWVLACTVSKFSSMFRRLLSKLIPKSLNLQSNTSSRWGQIITFELQNLPMGMTFVLSRFADNPEIVLKASMYLTQDWRESLFRPIVNVVSSAKVWAQISLWPILSPVIFLLLVILMRRISTTIIKMK